ncbi:PREDICTED: 23.6 kDa heat shock protein, mitochondrial [Tarenaya hassleriana]|uniref:23.6 kDa heat shock protein, mitochondrial n=1 Tax=Tarenaya hassleriana TaxID=28532 RepID=UPI00053C99E3|nr:PREDICTED: 23.6 kDa heat shock protein, mitochondrial [Tarenaya hassleriana]
MASSLALRRLLSSSVVPRSVRATRPAAASRLFNTDAVRRYDDDEMEHGVEVDRRSGRSVSRRRNDFFSDVFDPFSTTRNLSQVLNLMDQFMENPLLSATRGMGASGARRGWDVREKEDALYLRIDMPGLSKEDVKLALEQNTLVIRGEGKEEDDNVAAAAGGEEVENRGGSGGRRYTSRIEMPEKVYKTEEIKAEMKNGVLKVVIPKVKEEERSEVRHIEVQ